MRKLLVSGLTIVWGYDGGPGIAGRTEFVYSNDVWTLENTNSFETTLAIK